MSNTPQNSNPGALEKAPKPKAYKAMAKTLRVDPERAPLQRSRELASTTSAGRDQPPTGHDFRDLWSLGASGFPYKERTTGHVHGCKGGLRKALGSRSSGGGMTHGDTVVRVLRVRVQGLRLKVFGFWAWDYDGFRNILHPRDLLSSPTSWRCLFSVLTLLVIAKSPGRHAESQRCKISQCPSSHKVSCGPPILQAGILTAQSP